MATTLKNPTKIFNKVQQAYTESNVYICCNLFGKIYELDIGETKTFPIIQIKGMPKDIGQLLYKRFEFLEVIEVNANTKVVIDQGTEKKDVTPEEVKVNPLIEVPGIGEKLVKKLAQAGIQTIEDWNKLKSDHPRLKEVLGDIPARKFMNK